MIKTAERTYSFAEFEVDAAKRRLLKNAQTIALNPKAFDLLLVLIENCGNIVTKEELLDKVWANQFVEENNLTVHISALRKIFGEKKGEHQFIVTIPGTGYKFIAEINPQKSDKTRLAKNARSVAAAQTETQTTLIGRTREMAEITGLLGGEAVRLLTLTGAGGSGKTALAREIAAESKADFEDGVFFVELAAATEANFVISAIAQTLGIIKSDGKLPVEAVKDFLRTRRLLLILDNFEQVLSAAPLIKEFLAEAAQIKILVTSRAALRLKSEREFCVQPLDSPPPNAVFSIENLNEFPTIELFKTRARNVKPNFVLTTENIKIVAEICRRLDGLPLAIELAAVRVKLLAPQAILERLEHSLQLLTGGANDAPERQRTMRDTIRWSYDLLKTEEQFLFHRLAIFAGGFTVEAAEFLSEPPAVAGGFSVDNSATLPTFDPPATAGGSDKSYPPATAGDSDSALDLLVSLIDNNLLVSKEQAHGNVRLQMLEVVREFAFELLQKTGEIDILQRVHADYFLALAEQAEPYLSSAQSIEWLEKLETEHDNLRAALRWMLEREPEMAARTATALGQFWINRSYLTEARRWLEAALEKSDNAPSATRFKLLNSFSLVARQQGDYAATRRASDESLAASRTAKDLPQIILSCHAVAALETREGNFKAARNLFEEALTHSRKSGDEKQIAFTLSFLSNLFLAEGEPANARMPIEESLEICRRLGFQVNVNINLTNLGTVAYYEGDVEAAQRHFAESLTIASEMGNKTIVSCCLDGFAAVAAKRGNYEQSARLAGAADGLRESIGYCIELAEEIFRAEYLTKTRAVLSEKQFSALYVQGQNLNSDEASALVFHKRLTEQSDFADENFSEIIIESHKFERITIDEKIEP